MKLSKTTFSKMAQWVGGNHQIAFWIGVFFCVFSLFLSFFYSFILCLVFSFCFFRTHGMTQNSPKTQDSTNNYDKIFFFFSLYKFPWQIMGPMNDCLYTFEEILFWCKRGIKSTFFHRFYITATIYLKSANYRLSDSDP